MEPPWSRPWLRAVFRPKTHFYDYLQFYTQIEPTSGIRETNQPRPQCDDRRVIPISKFDRMSPFSGDLNKCKWFKHNTRYR